MHRGYFFYWRKTVDSGIWDRPPLYVKVWLWLLSKAHYETGELTCTLNQVAEGVQWEERGCPRLPARKTISAIFQWLIGEKMIQILVSGSGNRKYTKVSIINWGAYQDPESLKKTERKQKENRKVPPSKALKALEDKTDTSVSVPPSVKKAEKLASSPHFEFIVRIATWFYSLDQTFTPETPEALLNQKVEFEKILRIDFENSADCEARAERLLRWATQDDFWKDQVKSLEGLRNKRNGVRKWHNIESSMKRDQQKGAPPNGDHRPLDALERAVDSIRREDAERRDPAEFVPADPRRLSTVEATGG